jgi:uncharacterized protein
VPASQIIVAAAALCLPAVSAAQQPPPLELGRSEIVRSEVLNESRTINVLLPAGYEKGEARYPVIYLLDGGAYEDWFHAASLFDFLSTYDVMPPHIVIGIGNVDRRRDFTRPSTDPADLKAAPTSGGAERFMDFVERELVPHVEKTYRARGRRTLVGQSLAGLAATHFLLERPHLFHDYVIVDPSLWWNRRALLGRAPDLLKPPRPSGQRVYLSAAAGEAEMKAGAEALAALLKRARPEVALSYEFLPEETHATSLHISLYNAMRLLHRTR